MKIALVAGCSKNVFDEVELVKALVKPDFIIGVNDYVVSNKADYLASYHLDRIAEYKRLRKENKLPSLKGVFTSRTRPIMQGMDMTGITRLDNWGGSSGLMGVQAALYLGADRIILAGIPLTEEDGRIGATDPWMNAEPYRRYWSQREELKPLIRSMSGWTKEFYGEPDDEFLGLKTETQEVSE